MNGYNSPRPALSVDGIVTVIGMVHGIGHHKNPHKLTYVTAQTPKLVFHWQAQENHLIAWRSSVELVFMAFGTMCRKKKVYRSLFSFARTTATS